MNLPAQWHLIPIAQKTKHPGSIVGTGWQHKATADPQQIEAWKQQHTDCNWGLLLGSQSDVIDLEYDDDEGREIIEAAVAECGIQTVAYKSAKSVHRLFRFDDRFAGLKAKESYRGTEWRFGDNKAQSVIPPSVHETGILYEWLPGCSPDEIEVAVLPDALWDLYERLRDEVKPVPTVSMTARQFDGDGLIDLARNHVEQNHEWQDLLQQHGWKLLRVRGEASDWTRPGKKTGVSATLNFDNSGTLRVFSSSAAPLEAESSYDKFAFICRMVHNDDAVTAARAILPAEVLQMRRDDWFEQQESDLPEVDLSGIMAQLDGLKTEIQETVNVLGVITLEELQQLAAKEDLKDANAHLSEIHLPQEVFDDAPGFLGDYFRYTEEIAGDRMPEARLSGAIALMSVVTGRDFYMPYRRFRTRSNLYMLVLATSGAGKNTAREVNDSILREIEAKRLQSKLLGPTDFTSDSAILNTLKENLCQLFQMDEFSKILASMNSRFGSSPQAGMAKALMTLFTESGNRQWQSKAYADSKNQIDLDRPHAVVYGTCTDEFWSKLRPEQVVDGMLGRILSFEDLGRADSGDLPEADVDEDDCVIPQETTQSDVPNHLREPLEYWLDNRDPKEETVLKMRKSAFERLDGHIREMERRRYEEEPIRQALWARAGEKTSKLSMIAAMSRTSLIVELSDVNWAIKLVNALTRRMVVRAENEVTTGVLHENVNFVMKQFEKKPAMRRRDLIQKIRKKLSFRDRDPILSDLIETGELKQVNIQIRTKPGQWFGTSYSAILKVVS